MSKVIFNTVNNDAVIQFILTLRQVVGLKIPVHQWLLLKEIFCIVWRVNLPIPKNRILTLSTKLNDIINNTANWTTQVPLFGIHECFVTKCFEGPSKVQALISLTTNLFKHELSQSPDLVTVLGVIHNVVLHKKGLRRDKMRNICYAHTRSFSALQSLPESLLGWHSELASPRFSVESLEKHSHKVSKQSQLTSSSNEVKYSCLRFLCCVINTKFREQNIELKIEKEKHSAKWILVESNDWFYFDLGANLVSDFKSFSCHRFLLQIMSLQKHHRSWLCTFLWLSQTCSFKKQKQKAWFK